MLTHSVCPQLNFISIEIVYEYVVGYLMFFKPNLYWLFSYDPTIVDLLVLEIWNVLKAMIIATNRTIKLSFFFLWQVILSINIKFLDQTTLILIHDVWKSIFLLILQLIQAHMTNLVLFIISFISWGLTHLTFMIFHCLFRDYSRNRFLNIQYLLFIILHKSKLMGWIEVRIIKGHFEEPNTLI